MILTVECNGRRIITIEGLQDRQTGELDPLQQAFIDNTAFQCGFCTPGIIMAAKSLLEETLPLISRMSMRPLPGTTVDA
jgi:carbon-monoxide dehydrogenase small subunit